MRMTMMSNNNSNNNNAGNGRNFGDSEFTKVFVGGLAWETQKETMREHFEKYGEILEAVIISDKVTGRSKGYGFVTFKEPDAAKKACEESCPIINGRRANCNLAALGAKQHRRLAAAHTNSMPTPSPPLHGNVGARATSVVAPANHVHWPYHPAGTPPSAPASPFHHQHYHAVPFYGYSPTYIATGMYNNTYNQKVNYGGGWNGHFTQVYPGQTTAAIVGGNSTMMPVYPFYHHFHQTMGLPSHIYSPTTPGPVQSLPALISKPTPIPPNTVCMGVEQVQLGQQLLKH